MLQQQQIPFLWLRLLAIIVFCVAMWIVEPRWMAGLGAVFGVITAIQLVAAYQQRRD